MPCASQNCSTTNSCLGMISQCCTGSVGLVVHQNSYMYSFKWLLRFESWHIYNIAQTGR